MFISDEKKPKIIDHSNTGEWSTTAGSTKQIIKKKKEAGKHYSECPPKENKLICFEEKNSLPDNFITKKEESSAWAKPKKDEKLKQVSNFDYEITGKNSLEKIKDVAHKDDVKTNHSCKATNNFIQRPSEESGQIDLNWTIFNLNTKYVLPDEKVFDASVSKFDLKKPRWKEVNEF